MKFLAKQWRISEKNEDIKLVTTEPRRNYLVSELNYHTLKAFSENVLAIEIKKNKQTKKIANIYQKTVYLGISILVNK